MNDESLPEDGLRVRVEAGPEFRPSERLGAALDELGAALQEAALPEVAGFEISFNYQKVEWNVAGKPRELGFDSRRGFFDIFVGDE